MAFEPVLSKIIDCEQWEALGLPVANWVYFENLPNPLFGITKLGKKWYVVSYFIGSYYTIATYDREQDASAVLTGFALLGVPTTSESFAAMLTPAGNQQSLNS